MRAITLVTLLATMLLLGCNDASQQPQKSSDKSGGSVASAPADYLKSAAQSQQKAVKAIDLVAINKAIEAFYVQEGRFPKKLEELEEKGFIRVIPLPPPGKKINYNTNSGVVEIEEDLGNPTESKTSR
jgi:hypothetical protein